VPQLSGGPVRILRVIARLNVGGPALHVSYLAAGLDRIGYETTLAAGRVSTGEESMEYVARDAGVEPVFLSALQREISPVRDAESVRQLVRLIRELRPHILHTHTAKAGALGRTAALLAGSARPPVVVHTFHGHVLRGYFGPARTRAFLELERRLARTTDALVAVSPEVRDDLVALGVAPAERFTVIRLGIDLGARLAGDGATRSELGLADDAFVVGWFGRMTEIKRVDDLLRALARLLAREPRALLLLVGDGPLRAGLERLARELGVANAVRFLGYRNDVGALYGICDAIALTSANEGTPVVAIEALAARVPVVSTDVGGVSDVVRDGTSGFLTPPGDLDAFAARLATLASDEDLRRRFGEQGRRDVVPRYSVDRLVADVDTLYRALLDDVPRRAPGKEPSTKPLAPTLPPVRSRAARPLRIAILSQYFPPEVGATQSRMQAFAEHLAGRGHEVTVICEFPSHPHGVIPPSYRGKLLEDDRSNAYRIIRTWIKTNPRKTQTTRLELYLSYMALATAVSPKLGRLDVVLATTPPLFTAVAGVAIARTQHIPFVLDVRDLWPAAATSLDQISPELAPYAVWLERFLYRTADAVVAVTKPFCEHIDAIRDGGRACALVANGTLDLFFEDVAAEPRDDDAYLVTFAGTLGIAQALPSVLDAAALMQDHVRFQLVGDGPLKEILAEDAAGRGLANVVFRPQLPLEGMPPVLAASDALLVSLSAHPTFRGFVPSKLNDFMAAGKAVILAAAGESARVVDEAGAGVVVPPEDPEALAAAVRFLRDNPDEAAAMGARGRAFARTRMRSRQAERLEAVLTDVVERWRRR
jgi:glycosyltransferase involved in cell wall biosynthesis